MCSCAVQDPDAYNLQLSPWLGDPGTHPDLDVQWGPNTLGSDLLYHTQTQREAFAAYSQGVWQINDKFALTMGLRYARDELIAEENLWRYSETGGDSFIPAIFGSLAVMNMANGGFETDASLVSDANPFGVIFDELGGVDPYDRSITPRVLRVAVEKRLGSVDLSDRKNFIVEAIRTILAEMYAPVPHAAP